MNHREFGLMESAAAELSPFDHFAARCEKLCAPHLHTDHLGRPSFDGWDERDGYSIDWLYAQFKAGKRPLDVLHALLWRKRGLHKPVGSDQARREVAS